MVPLKQCPAPPLQPRLAKPDSTNHQHTGTVPSGYKGVRMVSTGLMRWQARCFTEHSVTLGKFATAREAAMAVAEHQWEVHRTVPVDLSLLDNYKGGQKPLLYQTER
jgi:hypothetical protein